MNLFDVFQVFLIVWCLTIAPLVAWRLMYDKETWKNAYVRTNVWLACAGFLIQAVYSAMALIDPEVPRTPPLLAINYVVWGVFLLWDIFSPHIYGENKKGD